MVKTRRITIPNGVIIVRIKKEDKKPQGPLSMFATKNKKEDELISFALSLSEEAHRNKHEDSEIDSEI